MKQDNQSNSLSGAIHSCRACSGPLAITMADLGMQPPANSFLSSSEAFQNEKWYPLRAKVCVSCKLVQIDYDVPPTELFRDYVYFSSYSDAWLEHAKRYCQMAVQRFGLGPESLVVELASNDGYLLKNFVATGIPVLGIDPSDTVAAAAKKIGVPTIVEFFGEAVAARLAASNKQADLIIANNVLAHVPLVNDFVAGISTLLKSEGTVTIEFPHLLKLIEHVEFDTIYHEHFFYISLYSMEQVFQRHGLRLYDVQTLPTHGGSLRIFACHADCSAYKASDALLIVRAEESAAGLSEIGTYAQFAERVDGCRKSMMEFLKQAKAEEKTVMAYGAAAKGNTLLNFCGITREDIPLVADRNPHKQGKLLPGTHIPVVSPEELLSFKPDYVLILPWNLKDEVMKQLSEVRSWDGRFVTPVPAVQIYK